MVQLKRDWLEEAKKLPKDKIMIDSVFSFEDVQSAYEKLNTGRARGKVSVEFAK